jgi:hypothetical protein
VSAPGAATVVAAAHPGGGLLARTYVAALCVALLVLQVLAAALPPPGFSRATATAAAGVGLVPVCTVEGLRLVAYPGASDETDGSGDGRAVPRCPLCLVAAAMVLALPCADAALTLPAPALQPVALAALWTTQAPVLRLASRPPPGRAPPLETH